MNVEACGHHLVTEVCHVLLLAVVKLVAFGEYLEQLDAGSAEHGRQGVAEQIRTAPLAEHFYNLLAAGCKSAHSAAEALSQGAGVDVDAAIKVELFGNATAGGAYDAGRMAFVHHHQSIVLFGQVADLVHRGHIAVHAEHAVGADDAESLGLGLLEAAFEIFHVGILVAVANRLAETHAVDNGGVVERIGDDGVFRCEQRLEHTAVGVEAGGVEDGVFRMEIFAYGLLQLLVQVLLAADEAHAAHAEAALVHGLLGGCDEALVVRQAEVVVGAEVKGLAAVGQSDFSALGRAYGAFVLVQARLFYCCELATKMILKFAVHSSWISFRITANLVNLSGF